MALSMGLKSGEYGGRRRNVAPASFASLAGISNLVGWQIIKDDKVSRSQARHQQSFHLGCELLAIHGSIHDHGGDDAFSGEPCDQCCGLPMTLGNGGPAAGAFF